MKSNEQQLLDSATGESPSKAESIYRDLILGDNANDVESIKVKEEAVSRLAALFMKEKDAASIKKLLTDLRPLFGEIPKAKTAKIVRSLIEAIAKVPNSVELQVCPPTCTVSLILGVGLLDVDSQ